MLAVLVVLIVIYIAYYYRHPKELNILQTTLRNFNFDMLREKQPIVVQDHVATLSSLADMWFKYNSVSSFDLGTSSMDDPQWIRNAYKFLVIQPNENCELLVTHPRDKPDKDNIMPDDVSIVAIQMNAGSVFIIPLHMHYAIVCHGGKKNVRCQCLGVHDLITRMLP